MNLLEKHFPLFSFISSYQFSFALWTDSFLQDIAYEIMQANNFKKANVQMPGKQFTLPFSKRQKV